ncbi:ABC transporter substrate-binding protein [uncultured Desulfosarcina sp.]|uniref:ABC transporter substrate-binding protein n=1 Tax=uncultured Desulfosarcina sp. TaxID=218289 RepID=UPI0029C8FF15|nr:ABC transporter substrate-binding protein [uncultured Desulfosarcina sp.]
MKKKAVAIISVFMVFYFFSAPVLAADTVKIAVMDPFSGNFRDIGDRYFEGIEYAVNEINNQGGLLGKKIEAVKVDTELKPDVATRKATKIMLKENVKFFTGGCGSSVAGAMSVLAEKNNLIYWTYGQEAASLTGPKCSRNFFRAAPNTDTHAYAMAAWVAKSEYKEVACIAQDYSAGIEYMDAFKRKLKEMNPSIKIVAELYHKLGEKDFAPYVSQIIASGAKIIYTPNWGNDLTLLVKQAKPLGLKAKFIGAYLSDDYMIRSVANDAAVLGSIACEDYLLSIPLKANKEFIAGFYKAKGFYPSWLRGKSYTATMFWAKAVKKAGSFDVDAVINAWEGLTYEGIAGPWYMRPCDHQAQVPMWMAELVENNEFFKHAHVGEPTMIPAKDIEVPCDKTGCPGFKK